MVELNTLTDALKERQKQLGSPEQVNRQLQQLKEMGSQGPADEFAKDLARGDFQKAAQELKKLQEKLQSGKMTEAEKKALKEQLGEMAKKLNELANLEQRKKQLEEARKNGGLSQQQFEREMEKLEEQAKGLKQLQQLASKLGKAQEAHGEGRHEEGRRALGMSQQQLAADGQAARGDGVARRRHGRPPGRQERHGGRRHEPARRRPQQPRHEHATGARATGRTAWAAAAARAIAPRPPTTPPPTQAKVKQPDRARARPSSQGFTTPGKTVKGDVKIDIQGEIDAAAGSVRRRPLQPEDPQERREAHPVVLRPAQQGAPQYYPGEKVGQALSLTELSRQAFLPDLRLTG